jgi:opacity protein-like surface antigen
MKLIRHNPRQRKQMKKLAVLFALALAAPAARAQYIEMWFNGGQSIFTNNGLGTTATVGGSEDDVSLGDGFRFSLRLDLNGDTLLGHEFSYNYSRTKLEFRSGGVLLGEQGMAVHTYGYNLLLHANHEGNRFRPFVTGGVGFSNYVPPGASALSGGGENKFGFNYGAGLKVRVVGPWALRFDVRQYTTPKPFNYLPLSSGWIRQNEISAGIGLVF